METRELTINKEAEKYGLEKSKAQKIEETFSPMVSMLKKFESAYNEVISVSDDEKDKKHCEKAKRLRIEIGKVRIETGKLKDKQKEYIKLEDKAIMGVHNIIVWAVKEKEDKLKDIENYFETKEMERIENLQRKREFELEGYGVDGSNIDLGNMQEDVYKNFLLGSITNYENKIKAEEEAEKARISAERKAEEERKAKEKAEAEERERIRKENERLKKEAEAREAEIEKEREKKRIENEKREAEIKKEREARELAEKQERQKRETAERELREMKERAEAEEAEAERKRKEQELIELAAESAPDIEKLNQLITDIEKIKIPAMKFKKYEKISSDVRELLKKVTNHIRSNTQ